MVRVVVAVVVMAGVGSHTGGLGGEVGLVNWGVNRGPPVCAILSCIGAYATPCNV